MSKKHLSSEELEALLRSEAPVLKRLLDHPDALPPEELSRIKKRLEEIHPFLRVLEPQRMRQVILEIFKTRAMDGPELAGLLRKNNVRLKDSTGEGELYGLLHQLENARVIEVEQMDGSERQKWVYRLTDSGRAELERVPAAESELAHWLMARATL